MLEYFTAVYYGLKDLKQIIRKGKSFLRNRKSESISIRLKTVLDLIRQECYETALRELEIALEIFPRDFRFWVLKAKVFDLQGKANEAMLYAGMAFSYAKEENQRFKAMEVLTQAYSLTLLKNQNIETLERLIQVQKQNLFRFGPSILGFSNVLISLWEGAFLNSQTGISLAGNGRMEMEKEAKMYFENLMTKLQEDRNNTVNLSCTKQILSKLRKMEVGLEDSLYWQSAIRELERLVQDVDFGIGDNSRWWGVAMARAGIWTLSFVAFNGWAIVVKAGIGIELLEDLIA